MKNGKLSVIIPFAQEHPMIAFTVQSIYCELRDKCDFEIIVIDNHCAELQAQLDLNGNTRDRGGEYMQSLANDYRPWLKYLTHDEALSHWQAKNIGVAASEGEFLWFVDSHCIVSPDTLSEMFSWYKTDWEYVNGTIHLPLSYMLERPGLELIYRLISEPDKGVVHYTFTRYRPSLEPYQVPCMSTCGMMMHRSIYDKLGGWPTELGIYGGGEHFINFTLATMGLTINIWPSKPLYHYAAPRGYHWNYDDYHRNRCIATYMFGDETLAYQYIMNINGDDPIIKESIFSTVAGSKACIAHKAKIKPHQFIPIAAWADVQMKLENNA